MPDKINLRKCTTGSSAWIAHESFLSKEAILRYFPRDFDASNGAAECDRTFPDKNDDVCIHSKA